MLYGFETKTLDAWVFDCCRMTAVVFAHRPPLRCPYCGQYVESVQARASAKVRFIIDKKTGKPVTYCKEAKEALLQ